MAFVVRMKETPERTAARSKANHSAAHTGLCEEIVKYLNAVGAWHARIGGGTYQRAGLPDIMGFILHPVLRVPVFFAIEVKTGTGKLRRNQKEVRYEIETLGGVYIEARLVTDVHDCFYAKKMVLVDLLVR